MKAQKVNVQEMLNDMDRYIYNFKERKGTKPEHIALTKMQYKAFIKAVGEPRWRDVLVEKL